MRTLFGYSDHVSARPGDTIRFMVSSLGGKPYRANIVRLICGDDSPAGPGFKEIPVATAVDGEYPGREQPIHASDLGHLERDIAAMTDHLRADQLLAMRAQRLQDPGLVGAHRPRVADRVGGDDGCQPALFPSHACAPPNPIRAAKFQLAPPSIRTKAIRHDFPERLAQA